MTAPVRVPRASRAARFTEADIKRALKAAQACGFKVQGYDVTWDGTIRVVLAEAGAVPSSGNPLDREFGCRG